MAARGERTFQAAGRDVIVLFTNRALAGAEKRLGKGIIGIANGFMAGESGMAEMAVLLQVGMEAARVDARAGGRPVSLDDAYAVMDEVGFAVVAVPVMEAVAAVLSYTPDRVNSETPAEESAPNG